MGLPLHTGSIYIYIIGSYITYWVPIYKDPVRSTQLKYIYIDPICHEDPIKFPYIYFIGSFLTYWVYIHICLTGSFITYWVFTHIYLTGSFMSYWVSIYMDPVRMTQLKYICIYRPSTSDPAKYICIYRPIITGPVPWIIKSRPGTL